MFGLEKEQPIERFLFDIEKEIQNKPERKAEMLKKANEIVQTLKKQLREGTDEKEFEKLGTLLNGYLALQKVITKINP